MRLIDADRLTEELWQDIIDQRKRRISEVIQEQPTIEAIPIEWIKEWIESYLERGADDAIRNAFEEMIDDWEKENDTQI